MEVENHIESRTWGTYTVILVFIPLYIANCKLQVTIIHFKFGRAIRALLRLLWLLASSPDLFTGSFTTANVFQ